MIRFLIYSSDNLSKRQEVRYTRSRRNLVYWSGKVEKFAAYAVVVKHLWHPIRGSEVIRSELSCKLGKKEDRALSSSHCLSSSRVIYPGLRQLVTSCSARGVYPTGGSTCRAGRVSAWKKDFCRLNAKLIVVPQRTRPRNQRHILLTPERLEVLFSGIVFQIVAYTKQNKLLSIEEIIALFFLVIFATNINLYFINAQNLGLSKVAIKTLTTDAALRGISCLASEISLNFKGYYLLAKILLYWTKYIILWYKILTVSFKNIILFYWLNNIDLPKK